MPHIRIPKTAVVDSAELSAEKGLGARAYVYSTKAAADAIVAQFCRDNPVLGASSPAIKALHAKILAGLEAAYATGATQGRASLSRLL